MLPMSREDIGGAIVRRYIRDKDGVASIRPGDRLTREQVLAMPRANLLAMVNADKITLFPLGGEESVPTQPVVAPERHIAHIGGGRFNVIEGRIVNDEPLLRAEAEALAGRSN